MNEASLRHIKASTIRSAGDGPGLLIISGVHGDEYEPVVTTTRLLKLLPDVLVRGSVTIVPVANEPAFRNACRSGDDGLDLARICPGKQDGSKTEAIAFELSELIRQSDYVIDLHTGGDKFELAPFAGFVLHPSESVLKQQYQMAMTFNMQTVWGTTPNLDGRTLSVARDSNVPAIYVEYGGGGGCKDEIVSEYVQGCLNVLASFGMFQGSTTSGRSQYLIKDYREESGNLDRLFPAPADGLFEADVRVGDVVTRGDWLGRITDPLTGQIRIVEATETGTIFLIRSVPSVREGDPLCGIWPVVHPGETVIS